MFRLALGLSLSICAFSAISQEILPKNGSTLTQTSILFEIPEVLGATNYEFQFAASDGSEKMAFNLPNQAIVVDSFTFGKNYHWTVFALSDKRDTLRSFSNSFKIENSPLVDPNLVRFKCLQQSTESNLDGVLFLDYSRVAITPDGKPIWFMPFRKELENKRLRDFKLTKRSSITYLDVSKCEEINLDGSIVWRTPSDGSFSGDSVDYFHHEFTRLSNGNYMVLGKTFIKSDLVIEDKHFLTIPLSIIIEFDAKGDVVWTWNSDQYITEKDIQEVGQKVGFGNTFGHMNSFFYDESNGIVYAGFRDLNCILAIDKASGRIIQSYGDKLPSDTSNQAIDFFRKQHASIKLPGGLILLFNNNDRNVPSTVQIVSEVTESNPESKIVWEFSCDFDTLMPAASERMGNALPLLNGSILVNMGTVARLFEVSKEKEILWQCFPEKRNEVNQAWRAQPNYRVFKASSLYPYHFTMALQKRDGATYIRIDNVGSENDHYEIILYKKGKKKRIIKRITVDIEAKNSTFIDLKKHYKKGKLPKSIFVEIRSLSNPDQIVNRRY